ncbi:VOC family protein [Paenibacillus alvei]|uniref:VOC family protein n=1 Tax=Paenibacillus alvei TaxID=44250 RepID=UPI0009DC2D20
MGSIIREIGSIFIPVKNLEESIHWYERILGFQLTVMTNSARTETKTNDNPNKKSRSRCIYSCKQY